MGWKALAAFKRKYSDNWTFPDPTILLHPNIPKPLYGLAPRDLLGLRWWDVVRHDAYARNNYKCWACNAKGQMQAHEIYRYDYKIGQAEFVEACALCLDCHTFIHSGRLEMLYEDGKITAKEYDRIMKHGIDILKAARLFDKWGKRHDAIKVCEDWSKWHLIVDGKKYYSKFKDYDAWLEHYKGLAS